MKKLIFFGVAFWAITGLRAFPISPRSLSHLIAIKKMADPDEREKAFVEWVVHAVERQQTRSEAIRELNETIRTPAALATFRRRVDSTQMARLAEMLEQPPDDLMTTWVIMSAISEISDNAELRKTASAFHQQDWFAADRRETLDPIIRRFTKQFNNRLPNHPSPE